MSKAPTHYEQVPLGLVMKILELHEQRKVSEESSRKDKQGQNAARPQSTVERKGA